MLRNSKSLSFAKTPLCCTTFSLSDMSIVTREVIMRVISYYLTHILSLLLAIIEIQGQSLGLYALYGLLLWLSYPLS